VVAKWLGFKKPAFAGRLAIRGSVEFKHGHGFEPKFMQFFGKGVRSGALPIDDNSVYWFVTWTPSSKGKTFTPTQRLVYSLCTSNFTLKKYILT
jgi:hypothetical protein